MIAFALHGAALWLLDAPDVSPEVSPRIPPLRVAIEAAPTRESVDAESGKVSVPPDVRPRKPREQSPASSGERGTRPAGAGKDGDGNAVPGVDALERPRDLTPADKTPATRFGRQPEAHPVFRPQRLVRAGEPPAPWSRGIWHRSAVVGEKRFQAVDGGSVWVRHYDNGDMKVCERSRDDLMDQWDDHLPFVCER